MLDTGQSHAVLPPSSTRVKCMGHLMAQTGNLYTDIFGSFMRDTTLSTVESLC